MSKFMTKDLFEITPEIAHLAALCEESNAIDRELYGKYDVKRGLRDMNGKGVLAGLTNVSDVRAKKIVVPAICITEVITLRIWSMDS